MSDDRVEPYSAAIRKLLKGVVYYDDAVWVQIRDYEHPIREYLAKVGLGLHLDEIGNFAYLYDESRDDDQIEALPALTSRRSLSFIDTLLLVLLRERLDEHEMRDLDGENLILNETDLTEMLSVFIGDQPDARQVEQKSTSSIKKLTRYGFLNERRDGSYVVRPLIRAKINADELDEIRQRLAEYIRQNSEIDEEDAESI